MLRTIFCLTIAILVFQKSALAQNCQPTPNDTAIWNSIKDSQNAADFAEYLKEFPNGCNRVVAGFKIRQLVPETVAVTSKILIAGQNAWFQAPNGGFLSHGDTVVEAMSVQFDSPDLSKLSIGYSCDAAGRGVTNATNGQVCPTSGRAPIQGYGLVLTGSYSQFYELKFDCTVRRGDHSTYHGGPQSSQGWCGAHGGTPNEYVVNVQVTLARKPLN
jgi:hypothetical protein